LTTENAIAAVFVVVGDHWTPESAFHAALENGTYTSRFDTVVPSAVIVMNPPHGVVPARPINVR
jgi:hypothetical protein